MWLSKRVVSEEQAEKAERGYVTLHDGNQCEIAASGTQRRIHTYAPYGYIAYAPIGEDVLLLPTTDGQVLTGCCMPVLDLQAGEVALRSQGGAEIRLCNDGSVRINGRYCIREDGQVTMLDG